MTTVGVSNPVPLAGQYQDPESGLIYLRARYYDPATGQFLSRDPAVAISGSAYGYVNDNPLNGTDPTGLFHYTFNFDLGASDLSASEFMSAVASNFGEVFPVHGHASQLTGNGQEMNLSWGPFPGPVRVSQMTETGWRFNAEPGHGDYPGWIDFNFSQTADCHLHLRVHSYVPDYSVAGGLFGKGPYRRFVATPIWSHFASNLREFNQDLEAG